MWSQICVVTKTKRFDLPCNHYVSFKIKLSDSDNWFLALYRRFFFYFNASHKINPRRIPRLDKPVVLMRQCFRSLANVFISFIWKWKSARSTIWTFVESREFTWKKTLVRLLKWWKWSRGVGYCWIVLFLSSNNLIHYWFANSCFMDRVTYLWSRQNALRNFSRSMEWLVFMRFDKALLLLLAKR